jgi:hypothetical protein
MPLLIDVMRITSPEEQIGVFKIAESLTPVTN